MLNRRNLAVCIGLALLITPEVVSAAPQRPDRARWQLFYMRSYEESLPRFEAAAEGIELWLGNERMVANHARNLRKQVDTVLRYIQTIGPERPRFDEPEKLPSDVKELAAHIAKSALDLHGPLEEILRIQKGNVIDIHFWKFVYHVEYRLLHLRWQTSLID